MGGRNEEMMGTKRQRFVLDFYLAESPNRSRSKSELLDLTESDFSYGAFEGDITFRIGVCDLSMNLVTLVDFAAQMLRVRDEIAADDSECVFDFTEGQGELTFKRAGDDVQVRASYVTCEARVSFEVLSKEIEAFAQRLRVMLMEKYPLVLENKALQKMLRISARIPGN